MSRAERQLRDLHRRFPGRVTLRYLRDTAWSLTLTYPDLPRNPVCAYGYSAQEVINRAWGWVLA